MELKLAAGCLLCLLSLTHLVSTTEAFSSFHHPTKASSDIIARTTLLTAKDSTTPNLLQSELVERHDGGHKSSPINDESCNASGVINRRSAFTFMSTVAVGSFSILSCHPLRVQAKTDCMGDCLKNCKLIAPKVKPVHLCVFASTKICMKEKFVKIKYNCFIDFLLHILLFCPISFCRIQVTASKIVDPTANKRTALTD